MADEALLDGTDLVLLDVKAGSEELHHRLTGRPFPLADSAVRTREPVAEVRERFSAHV